MRGLPVIVKRISFMPHEMSDSMRFLLTISLLLSVSASGVLSQPGATYDPAAHFTRGQPDAGADFADDLEKLVALHGAETIAAVIEEHGRLDILVNNAGITIDKTVAKMTDEDWYKVLAVNLSGAFFMSQAALAHMIERGTGRIINVSSFVGEQGNIGQANYAASKSGLFGLTRTMALEAAHTLHRAWRTRWRSACWPARVATAPRVAPRATAITRASPENRKAIFSINYATSGMVGGFTRPWPGC